MNRKWISLMVMVLIIMMTTSVCVAATIEGSGSQTRGTPGHAAELNGKTFTLPAYGTITDITGEGAEGFWIERADGSLVVNFNSLKEAAGYGLSAGSYRVLPNLRESPKANYAWVRITVNCP